MPYTKIEDRKKAIESGAEAPGDLTYLVYCLVVDWVHNKGGGMSYTRASQAVGVLETAKSEFIRKFLDPYEDQKARENGGVGPKEAKFVATHLRSVLTPEVATTKTVGSSKSKGKNAIKRSSSRAGALKSYGA